MTTMHLHIDRMLQGDFEIKPINIALIFQVNCPGCFAYSFPLFNKLYRKFNSKIGCIGLSTAFEDFKLNTQSNTELLLQEGTLIGETKKASNLLDYKKLPFKLEFPVGMDSTMKSELQKAKLIKDICLLNPNYLTWSSYDKELLEQRVKFYLQKQEKVSLTFTANQFRGTPTIALFNAEHDLLHSWFGRQDIQNISNKIEDYI